MRIFRRMYKLSFLLTCFLAALSLRAAGPVLDVNVQGVAKQSLSLNQVQASGSAAQTYLKVLQNDLLRSGRYNLRANGQVNVSGTIASGAGATPALSVTWPGKRFGWNYATTDAQLRAGAHALADAIVNSTTGEKGFAQSKLALVRREGKTREGQNIADLYVCDYDGYNLKRITRDRAAIVGPRWSHDGKYVYFTSYKLGFPAVFRADLNGNVTRLANFKGLNTGAVPSPVDSNSVAIILSHQGNPELYVMNASTRALTRLTRTAHAAEASPCWSPDGKKICYVSDQTGSPQLYVVDVASKQSRRLTLKGGENVQPDWSEGGIVFATRRGAPYQIGWIDPAVGESSFRTLTPKNEIYESPSWAADGRHVVAARTQGRNSSIWILDSEKRGDAPYKAFSGSGDWGNPAWTK